MQSQQPRWTMPVYTGIAIVALVSLCCLVYALWTQPRLRHELGEPLTITGAICMGLFLLWASYRLTYSLTAACLQQRFFHSAQQRQQISDTDPLMIPMEQIIARANLSDLDESGEHASGFPLYASTASARSGPL